MPKNPMGLFGKNILYAILIFLALTALYASFTEREKKEEVSLSRLVEEMQAGEVLRITVEENNLEIALKNGMVQTAQKEPDAALSETLINYGVAPETLAGITIEVKQPSGLLFWFSAFLPFLLPIVLIGVFIWLTMRQVQRSNGQALMFGQSRARVIHPDDKREKVTFKDVAGVQEAKEELVEIVDFLKNPQKFLDIGARIPRGVLLMGAPGTGKCVTGDTLLSTNKGLIPIDEVPKYFTVRPDSTVEGLDVVALEPKTLEFQKVAASHWYELGVQKTKKIVTDMGLTIEGTSEHPVIVVDRETGNFLFKRLDEVTPDEKIVVGYNQNIFGTRTKVPHPDVAYLLGVLTGDGCLTVRGRTTLSTADPEVLHRIQDIALQCFGTNFVKSSSRKWDYELQSLTIKAKLRGLGLEETYAEGKRMPEWIRLAPKEFVVEFLRGIFDTDGYAEQKGAVGFSSASERLVTDVASALLNVGIVSRVYTRKKRYNGKTQYYLTIYGDFVERFREEVGFSIARKIKFLDAVCARQRNTNVNIIPHQRAVIKAVWQATVGETEQRLDRAFYGENLYKNVKRYMTGERSPSPRGVMTFVAGVKELAPMVAQMPEVAYLTHISAGQFFFTSVKEISSGEAVVYDLTVPHLHNFVANGFINHNTLLAKAVAGEAGVPFFHMSASEFVEMFVGVGASRVRDLFRMAKKAAPAIIFVDEIDAVGRHRGAGLGGGHDEREQTLNQILTEMDGFETSDQVIVIAATNRPDVLDPALLRPGRFDRRVVLDLPDIAEREAILQVHTVKKIMGTDVNLRQIAERTPGFSGADLANLVNEAAILAARSDRKTVSQEDLIVSIEKVMLGPERKSKIFSEKEKKITAYHEAGHALVAASLPNADPVHKISIVARGRAGGYTMKLPTEDRHLYSKEYFLDELAVSLGGYAAEETVFGEITTGSSDDIRKATSIARGLVTRYGMSDKVGPVAWDDQGELIFLGKEIGHEKKYSEGIASLVDSEVERFMKEALEHAKEIVREKRAKLTEIAEYLIQHETIEQDTFRKLMGMILSGEPASTIPLAA